MAGMMMLRESVVVMVFMPVIMGNRIPLFPNIHYPVGSGNAPPFVPVKFQAPTGYGEFMKFFPYYVGIKPQIRQGSKGHVPGNAGKTVEM
jgi:hypothetical protein